MGQGGVILEVLTSHRPLLILRKDACWIPSRSFMTNDKPVQSSGVAVINLKGFFFLLGAKMNGLSWLENMCSTALSACKIS